MTCSGCLGSVPLAPGRSLCEWSVKDQWPIGPEIDRTGHAPGNSRIGLGSLTEPTQTSRKGRAEPLIRSLKKHLWAELTRH